LLVAESQWHGAWSLKNAEGGKRNEKLLHGMGQTHGARGFEECGMRNDLNAECGMRDLEKKKAGADFDELSRAVARSTAYCIMTLTGRVCHWADQLLIDASGRLYCGFRILNFDMAAKSALFTKTMGKIMNISQTIDRTSFILGMVTAFAECVANESKKAALSPPFYPQDYETVLRGVENIAKDQEISTWYEENLDIPEDVRLNWFVLFKFPGVLEEYQHLRKQGFNPALHLEEFSELLSYGTAWGEGADSVVPKMREKRLTIDTYATVLLKPGDWPIQIVE
jgi:hypothetical protein